jgi:phosphoglycerate kinase
MLMLDDLLAPGVRGRAVLVRSDLNVPIRAGRVSDDGRLRAAAPVLSKLLDHGARVIVAAHLGRPGGRADPAYSLRPVAGRLAELLGRPVDIASDTAGESARARAADLAAGQLLLLENVRFCPEETANDHRTRLEFAGRLAGVVGRGGAFVQDAFGALHRTHASVCEITALLPGFCGDLVRDELTMLRALAGEVKRPFVVVLGGAKVSDKLAVVAALLPRVDRLLIGGGMCFTFLAAQGHPVGDSLVEPAQIGPCRSFLTARAADGSAKIRLPSDVVAAADIAPEASSAVVAVESIAAGRKGLDIGPATSASFAAEIAAAATVFWNGPMGVFEVPAFAAGTRAVAAAAAAVQGLSVVGGGDSAAVIRALGFRPGTFSHVSTGGGASLEFIQGRTLPGLAALGE